MVSTKDLTVDQLWNKIKHKTRKPRSHYTNRASLVSAVHYYYGKKHGPGCKKYTKRHCTAGGYSSKKTKSGRRKRTCRQFSPRSCRVRKAFSV